MILEGWERREERRMKEERGARVKSRGEMGKDGMRGKEEETVNM